MPEYPEMHPELVVLTGDLVGSGRLGPGEVDAAMAALSATATEAMRVWGFGRARFTRFRGDGWQCLAPHPRQTLRVMLLLQARLRQLGPGFATRIAAGIGAGRLPPDSGLGEASGPAFELSGRGLDRLGATARLSVDWEAEPEGADWLRAVFALCDEISRHWTVRQAEIMAASLGTEDQPSQSALADRFGVSQQTIGRLLAAGGHRGLVVALGAVEG